MTRGPIRSFVPVLLGPLLLVSAPPARARSLADSLHVFIDENASIFVGGVADTLTPLLTRLAERGTSLPATSTLPGVSYRTIVELGTFEREAGPLGAVFLERAETLGRGRLALGFDYLFADLTDFDGRSLAKQLDYRSDLEFAGGTRVRTSLAFQTFSLESHQVALSSTYGLTERWDVNLLLPFVYTKLDVKARRTGRVDVEPPVRDTVELHADAAGIGDVLLRTKYQLPVRAPLDLAANLQLYAPTGAEGDFHGLGDWRVVPLLVGSRAFGRHGAHLNLGLEVNADDLERTRARYGIGASLQPVERLAVLIDLIGSSSFVADEFEVRSTGNFASSRNDATSSTDRGNTARGVGKPRRCPRSWS